MYKNPVLNSNSRIPELRHPSFIRLFQVKVLKSYHVQGYVCSAGNNRCEPEKCGFAFDGLIWSSDTRHILNNHTHKNTITTVISIMYQKYMKEESEKIWLKLKLKRLRVTISRVHHHKIDGKKCGRLFSWTPKSLQMQTTAMRLKDACSLGVVKNLDSSISRDSLLLCYLWENVLVFPVVVCTDVRRS